MTTNALDMLSEEICSRLNRLKAAMQERDVDAVVITDRANFEYLTGFRSLFWASATRPYFALVLRSDAVIHVFASRAEERNAISAPPSCQFHFYPLFLADAIVELGQVIRTSLPRPERIAIDYGKDMFGRGSLDLVRAVSSDATLVEADDLMWSVRLLKSEYEIEIKRRAHKVATDSFFSALRALKIGDTEKEFSRTIAIEMLHGGAENFDFLPVRFGKSEFAYPQPPSDRRLERDDFIWVDLGCIVDGYHSDVNRIAKAGKVTERENEIYKFVRDLTIQTAEFVRPGMLCSEVAAHYDLLFSKGPIKDNYAGSGRFGHGSGVGLTEPPSLMKESSEIIRPGMILHVEPKIETNTGVFQIEEAFVVRDNGIEFLTELAPPLLPSLFP